MTRAVRHIIAISVWVVLAVLVPPLATMPTVGATGIGDTATCVDAHAVRVVAPAYLREGPQTTTPVVRSVAEDTVLGVLGHETNAGACWYHVRDETVPGGDGWISSIVVRVEQAPEPSPPALGLGPTPSSASTASPSANSAAAVAPAMVPTVVAVPTPATNATVPLVATPGAVASPLPFVETLPTPQITTVEPNTGSGHDHEDDVVVPVARALVIRVCLDVNENSHCDADEGIGGMPWVAQDGVTGQVLDHGITDYTGTAQRNVVVRPDRGVTVNIPYLGTVDTYSGTNVPRARLITTQPNIPSGWP